MTRDPATKLLAATLLTACFSLEACRACSDRHSNPSDGRPTLAGVTVKPIAPALFQGAPIHLDESQLAASIRGTLDGAQIFAPPANRRPTAQVSVEAEVSSRDGADASEIIAKVHLRITVRPTSGVPTRYSEDVAGVGQAPLVGRRSEDARLAFQRLLERIAGDSVLAYAGRLKLWEGDSRAIASALQSTDNELRVEALHVVGARQLREQIPTVLQLLTHEDEGVRDAALGTLVVLREHSAVKALAESRQMRDTREMRKILDAIATLGGNEARDYLSFVAETHDDEEIRTMAAEALERLQRRTGSGEPTK